MIDTALCMGYNIYMKYCIDCNTKLKDSRSTRCKSCAKTGSLNPQHNIRGKSHHNWKGGYIHKISGYKLIMADKKKVYEHRYVMEQHLGRKLDKKEVVHHINGNKLDNRIDNLQLTTQSEHVTHHKPMLGKKSKVKRDPITQRFVS